MTPDATKCVVHQNVKSFGAFLRSNNHISKTKKIYVWQRNTIWNDEDTQQKFIFPKQFQKNEIKFSSNISNIDLTIEQKWMNSKCENS